MILELEQKYARQPVVYHLIEIPMHELLLGLGEELDTEPTLTTEDAYRMAETQNGIGVFTNLRRQSADLHILYEHSDRARLVYRVSLVAQKPYVARPICFIDAHSSEMLDCWDALSGYADILATGTGGNAKTGCYTLGKGDWQGQYLSLERQDDDCVLRNDRVTSYDLDQYRNYFDQPYHFPCSGDPVHNAGSGINGACAPINDAHYFATQAAQRLGLSGLKIGINVDDRPRYKLAWWDGTGITIGNGILEPAFWHPNLDCPEGVCQWTYPPAVVDIVGHEVAHAYIEHWQGPENRKNSDAAALNEAFADIVGVWLRDQLKQELSWAVGPEVSTGPGHQGIRDFRRSRCRSVDCLNPGQGLDKYTRGDVIREAFYALVNREGLSLNQAFALYRKALERYWPPRLTFQQAAQGVYCAAEPSQKTAVETVFSDVGIKVDRLDPRCEPKSSVNPPPDGFQFQENEGVLSDKELRLLLPDTRNEALSPGGKAGVAVAVTTVVTGVTVAIVAGLVFYFRKALNQRWHRLTFQSGV